MANSFHDLQKLLAEGIEYDANWVDEDAQGVVDLVIVYDNSAGVDDTERYQAKEFLKSFLEYFSVSPLDAQIGSWRYSTLIVCFRN